MRLYLYFCLYALVYSLVREALLLSRLRSHTFLGLITHIKTWSEDRAAAHLLNSISNARKVAEALLKDSDQPTSDTDSSDDDEFEDDFCDNGIGRMAEEIKTFTNCLLDLSAALERPALDANHADVVSRTQHDSLTDTGVSEPTEPSSLPVESWSTPSWIHYTPAVLGKMDQKSMHLGNQRKDIPRKDIPSKDIPRKSHTKRTQLTKRVFQCPFRKAQGKLGLLPYTCTAVPMTTVSAIETHLTRILPGGKSHLPFLRLCPTCREYVLDEHEFKTFHGDSGLKCEATKPQLKGDSTVEQTFYDSLYSKVEAYIVAQSLNGMYTSDANMTVILTSLVPLAPAARPDLHQRLLPDEQDTPHSRTHSHTGEDQDDDLEKAPPSP